MAVHKLGASDADSDVMIPLNSSLYIPGKLQTNEKVMVELGAGYFAEYDVEGAKGYCDRKRDFVEGSAKKVSEIIEVKAFQLQKIAAEL